MKTVRPVHVLLILASACGGAESASVRGAFPVSEPDVAEQPPVQVVCPQVPAPAAIASPRRGHRVVVTVYDYRSLDPIAGVQVELSHAQTCNRNDGCRPTHRHPPRQLAMRLVTDAQGQATFRTPDLDYGYAIPQQDVPGYLTFSSNYDLGAQRCHDPVIRRESRDGRTLAFDLYLVPERLLSIRTREEAVAAAHRNGALNDWLREHGDAVMTVRGGGTVWQVGYGYGSQLKRLIRINAFDGTTAVIGRWN